MKKITAVLLSAGIQLILSAQSADPVILSYQRNFIRASISTKLELLNDASRITNINMTPLYIDALKFVASNYPILDNDSQLMDIAVIASSKSTGYQDFSILPVIKEVFTLVPETRVRIACISAFSVLGKQDSSASIWLASWLQDSAGKAVKGESYDPKVLSAGAAALGTIGAIESFDTLFRLSNLSLDSSVTSAASNAINKLSDGYTAKILAIIGQKNIKEAYMAFSLAMKRSDLQPADKGAIAAEAFALGVDSLSTSETAKNSERISLINESMKVLTELSWSNASPVVVKYFYQVQGDYKNGKTELGAMIPVVRCMGAMGSYSSVCSIPKPNRKRHITNSLCWPLSSRWETLAIKPLLTICYMLAIWTIPKR
jgi:hypothetical protein